MNTDRFFEAKQELKKELGNAYPSCREELTPMFLISFANFIPGIQNTFVYRNAGRGSARANLGLYRLETWNDKNLQAITKDSGGMV